MRPTSKRGGGLMDLDCPRFSGLPEGSRDGSHPNSSASRPTLKEHLPSPSTKPIYVWDVLSPAIRPAVESPFADRTDGEMSEKGPASMSRTPGRPEPIILRVRRPSEIPHQRRSSSSNPRSWASFSHTSECEHSSSLSTIIIKVRLTVTDWFATHANCNVPSLCSRTRASSHRTPFAGKGGGIRATDN
jgi:hypothetical protein